MSSRCTPLSRITFAPAREMLDLPCTTGEAVPVAFSLYMPVENDDGAAGFETVGGVLQEEATSEEAMVALEGLMRCLFLHVTRRVVLDDDPTCDTNDRMLKAALHNAQSPLHRVHARG